MKSLYVESSTLLQHKENFRVYKERWTILFIYFLISFSNVIQIQQYASIMETVMEYYGCSMMEVNFSVIVYIIMYIPLLLPSTYLVEKLGLRKTILLGAFGTALAAWIKVAAVSPNRFWIVILGQSVNAISQVIISPIPPKIAAVWFGFKEISLACSIGFFATPISLAMGFIIPTTMVNPALNSIESGLYYVSILYTVIPTILIFISLIYVSDCPPTPPTIPQNQGFLSNSTFGSFKKLISNSSFMCLVVAYGINMGVFCAFSALLNPIILKHYPNGTAEVGITGFVMNLIGSSGTVATGAILDRFRKYELTLWITTLCHLASLTAFNCFIGQGIYMVYILSCLYGFFWNTLLPMYLELGIELMYPESEIIIANLLIVGSQIAAVFFTSLFTYLLQNCSFQIFVLVISCILIFGDSFLFFVKYDLKRSKYLSRDAQTI